MWATRPNLLALVSWQEQQPGAGLTFSVFLAGLRAEGFTKFLPQARRHPLINLSGLSTSRINYRWIRRERKLITNAYYNNVSFESYVQWPRINTYIMVVLEDTHAHCLYVRALGREITIVNKLISPTDRINFGSFFLSNEWIVEKLKKRTLSQCT